MEMIEAMYKRKSIRDFLPDPVSREVLKEILELAVRAPSGVNSQSWEFAIITGEPLEKLKDANVKCLRESIEVQTRDQHYYDKESVYKKRQVELAIELFKLMGIERGDKVKRKEWLERGFRYFDAPAAIVLLSDRSIPEEKSSMFLDVGAVMYGICLAALKFDLGTCIEAQGCRFEEPLREYGNIPDNKRIHVAIAIGKPNWDFPANRIESAREAIDNISIWSGFEV